MPVIKSKFILDTNVWISFLIKKNFTQIDNLLYEDQNSLIFSTELLNEFLDVVRRPKFTKFFSPREIEIALEIIIDFSEFVNVTSDIQICRDPKDNYLLSMAVDSNANYLVTGDNDLLILNSIEHTKIISVFDFIKLI